MKKIVFLISIFLFAQSSIGQDEWESNITFAPGQTLKDILAISPTTIYGISALYSGTALNVKKTVDNGDNWVEQYAGHTSMNYYELASPDSVDIFAVANGGIIIHNSGGETWATVASGTTENLRTICFVNSTIGFIGGDGGTILKTTDGGATWIDLEATLDAPYSPLCLEMINETQGFLGGHSFLQVTFDGGLNWTFVDGFAPGDGTFAFREIQFINNNLAFACGDQGAIWISEDGGLTWTLQETGTTESIQDIRMIDENIGFACGFNGVAIRTEDAGETWTNVATDISENFYTLDFHESRGYMGSYFGTVLTFEFISPGVSISEFKNHELSIYPNPSVESITFSGVSLVDISRIEVIQMNGEVVLEISTPAQNTIDCSGLESGTYIVRIHEQDGGIVSRSFIKK
ncbi:MAG: T9SS type A sorting domain-containing protein [Crocinitomix sp.]|nr:T9SS type A sorting domain-containing protein [Crocinitomix sp.]